MWTACRPLGLFLPGRVSVNLDLVLVTLALMAVIVAGVAAIFWVDRWRKRPPEQGSGDELQTFQKLYDQGLLSTEEFEQARHAPAQAQVRLVNAIRRSLSNDHKGLPFGIGG